MSHTHDRVLILDFGSQFTQLIARRIREESVYCEIHSPDKSLEWIKAWNPAAVILSGGPSSVYDEDVPTAEIGLLNAGIPILGICYGFHLIAHLEGAEVEQGKREYGRAELQVQVNEGIFEGFHQGKTTTVWCSHGDHVDELPSGYKSLASTDTLRIAAFRAIDRPIYAVQFHPEVAHTDRGDEILVAGPDGIRKARTIRRQPEEDRWNKEQILAVRGTPLQPNPGSSDDRVKTRMEPGVAQNVIIGEPVTKEEVAKEKKSCAISTLLRFL